MPIVCASTPMCIFVGGSSVTSQHSSRSRPPSGADRRAIRGRLDVSIRDYHAGTPVVHLGYSTFLGTVAAPSVPGATRVGQLAADPDRDRQYPNPAIYDTVVAASFHIATARPRWERQQTI